MHHLGMLICNHEQVCLIYSWVELALAPWDCRAKKWVLHCFRCPYKTERDQILVYALGNFFFPFFGLKVLVGILLLFC